MTLRPGEFSIPMEGPTHHRYKVSVKDGQPLTSTRTLKAALAFGASWADGSKRIVQVEDRDTKDGYLLHPDGTQEYLEPPRPHRVVTEIVQFQRGLAPGVYEGVRKDVAGGMKQRDVAARWGISQGYVSKIANQRRYE